MKEGYIIKIFKILSINDGVVDEEGDAIFTVQFKALVFKPMRGEVIDGVVIEVNRPGIHLKIGTVRAFIPHNKIPEYYEFDENNGYFVNPNERLNIIEMNKVNTWKIYLFVGLACIYQEDLHCQNLKISFLNWIYI